MRIDKVEIDGFGKLNNCEYTFADGVNLIFGENESGKSTLCEFILSAFYGLPNESKRVLCDITPRKKYRPWNTEAFGGRLYFTDDSGKKLVIERSFKGTKRGDKAVLRDAESWEELDSADSLGEKIFGLSREAFMKTLYVKSFGADGLKDDDGEIMSRLMNLETSGSEDVSYSKIINAMEKEIFSIKSKTGRGGAISALQDRELALKQELSISKMTYTALAVDSETAESLKDEAQKSANEVKELEKKYELAVLHEKYLHSRKIAETRSVIEKRLQSETEKLEKIEKQLSDAENGDAPTVSAEEISRARALETKKLLAQQKLEEQKSKEVQNPKSNKAAVIATLIAGAALLMMCFISMSVLLGLLGVVCVLVSGTMVFASKKKQEELFNRHQEEMQNTAKELEGIAKELDEIFAPYGVSISDELSALFMNSKSAQDKRAELVRLKNECEAEIQSLKNSIPEDTNEEEFSPDAVEYSGESSEEIYARIKELKEKIAEINQRISDIELHITRESAEIRKESDISAELSEVTEEIVRLEKRHAALSRAARWLTLAHTEIKNNFAPKLNEKTSEFLSFLTDKKYTDVRTNDSFELNLQSTSGKIVEAGAMSRGTYDILYIALRFAAMSVITDGKIPPVILDDAFSQLDDTRLMAATDLIYESREFSQVLLFTCHENYKGLLSGKNINIVSL